MSNKKKEKKDYEKQIPKISDLRILLSNLIADEQLRFKIAKSLFIAEKAASVGSVLGKSGLIAGFIGGTLIGYFSATPIVKEEPVAQESPIEEPQEEPIEESEPVE